jgi:hypothetical protein
MEPEGNPHFTNTFFKSRFNITFLMAYSKAKLKRNGDKASPYFGRAIA